MSHMAQAVPRVVPSAVAKENADSGETCIARTPPLLNEPRRMPVKTQMFSRAMTEPRRSCGARHCTRALMGMKISALETPKAIISRSVPLNAGLPTQNQQEGRDAGHAQRDVSPYSTRTGESADDQRAAPDAYGDQRRGTVANASERPSTALAYTSTF